MMNELIQAEQEHQEEDQEEEKVDQSFKFEDKVNQEEFKDLIAKTINIMRDVEEESYDSEDELIDPHEEREGDENLEDEETPVIQNVMTKINKINMNQLNLQQTNGMS